MEKNNLITLYTIQPEFKYNELINNGVLLAHPDIICQDYFKSAYSWMESKMKQNDREIHPIWAWFKYKGKYIPDLRNKGFLLKGEIGYRIEFKVNIEDVLLTDFSDWHVILNSSEEDIKNGYIEIDDIENTCEYFEELNSGYFDILNSKIVFYFDKIIVNLDSKLDYIQATLWKLKKEQIVSVKKFKSR